MQVIHDVVTAFVAAILIPLSLFTTLLIVRAISYIWYVVLNRRPLPIIIHGLTMGNNADSVSNTAANSGDRAVAWQSLPSMLRDYISVDPPLARQLAPGIGSPASPVVPAATPGPQASWSTALADLVLPQKKAAYDIYITPRKEEPRISASVMVVKTPEQWIAASKAFEGDTLEELTLYIGGFCMECVQLEPAFLRRTPRWEHWGSSGGYRWFRQALEYQERGDYAEAYSAYAKASELSLGNVRLGVYRASLYELEEKYDRAALLYDALHCLWKQNIEVAFRAAAVRVNQAHKLFAERGEQGADEAADVDLPTTVGKTEGEPSVASIEHTAELRELKLMSEAQAFLWKVKKDLRYRKVLWKWLRTWFPRRRDVGERRYWLSWLSRDDFRQPLILLRRSKRYEYLNAVKVAMEANQLLRFSIQDKLVPGSGSFKADRSFRKVSRLIRKKRIGWLAHWTAACYFSRAVQAPFRISPSKKLWRRYERRTRMQSLASPPLNGQAADWQQYCEVTAIGEIGRVLRNPCHQLNVELLNKDPDMKPLHNAFKAGMVSVLIGPIGELGETLAGVSHERETQPRGKDRDARVMQRIWSWLWRRQRRI